MYYRLNKAETVPVTLYHVAKSKVIGGKKRVTYDNFIRLAPGEEYETDDEAMLAWFSEHRRKVRWTEKIERTLKTHGVPYETEMCKSCGGKVKKISYQVVEVYDE